MIENVTEVIRKYLEEEDYKILDIDDDGCIRIRYQMTDLCIVPNVNVPNFVTILIPSFDEMDPEDPLPAVSRCLRIVSTQLVVKVYPTDKNTIVATYESFFNNEDDLIFQVTHGLDELMSLNRNYRLLKRQDQEEALQEAQDNDQEDIEDIEGDDEDVDGWND